MRLMSRARRARAEEGFTLPELVITVAIMGIIVAALAGILISYLKTTVDAEARTTESTDVQFAATYWQRDVASIGVRSYDSSTKSFPLQQSVNVAPSCALPTGTTIVTLAWSEFTSADSTAAPTKMTVSYLAQADGAGYDLVRVKCTGSTVNSTVKVAHSLNKVPTATCNVACSGTGNAVPSTVILNLSVLDPEGNGTVAYTAMLSGERRQS
jgi:prepilin-type N-terminal cleavage/methylation domain-containing protein